MVRQGLCKVKLKPRTKPQETSEDQREEQYKGPDRERSLHWSRTREKVGWLEHKKKGEQYRMRPNSQRPPHAGQSWEFLPSEVGGQERIIGKAVT